MTQKFHGEVDAVAGRDVVSETRHAAPVINIGSIHGGHNIIGNQGGVHIQVQARPKVVVVVQPPTGSVDEPQKLRLRELVREIVALEKVARRQPKAFAQVWFAFQQKLRVTSYQLLPADRFDEAEAWLLQWRARLSGTKSARKTGAPWRKGRYAYIHAAAKELGRADDLPTHLAERYDGRGLSELSDDELQAVYQTVAGWKQAARRNGAL